MLTKEDGLELLRLAGIEVKIEGNLTLGEGEFIIESQRKRYPVNYLNNDLLIVQLIQEESTKDDFNAGYQKGRATLKNKLESLLYDIENETEYSPYYN